jgi:putative restriction endonuclease
MPRSPNWSENELLVAFRLYCHTEFGKLHQHNPEIIAISQRIDRTPSALAMKACNFASLDPAQQRRNISGLGNASRADRALWEQFAAHPDNVATQAEASYAELMVTEPVDSSERFADFETLGGPTESARLVRVRRVQQFFRAAVLTSYGHRCAVSGMALPEMLIASHIIPWRAEENRRADPRNGLALNSLYDRAFDVGLITFDESWRLVLSKRLKQGEVPDFQRSTFLDIEGQPLHLPIRFEPDPKAMTYHREHCFQG